MNRFHELIIVLGLALFIFGIFFTKNSVFQGPISDSIVTCNGISGFEPEGNTEFLMTHDGFQEKNESPQDCVIFSLAYINYLLFNKTTFGFWYDKIENCSLEKGYYNPKIGFKGKVSDLMKKVEEECKAPIANALGKPENFTRNQPTAQAINALTCPPYRINDNVVITLFDPVPRNGKYLFHVVPCKITDCSPSKDKKNTKISCTDHIWNGGNLYSYSYDLVVDSMGNVGPASPPSRDNPQFLMGSAVVYVSKPSI